MRHGRLCLSLALLLLGLACASGGGNEAVVLDPPSPVVAVGERLPLAAYPQEALAGEPQWELQELHGGGFLKSRGERVTYVAPPSAGTYHLILRAQRADGSPVKQIFEIRVQALLSIDPPSIRLAPGGSLSFAAHLKGLPRPTVAWSVEESGGGTITNMGLYTAPSQPGTYHVVAASTVDPTVSTCATVQVE